MIRYKVKKWFGELRPMAHVSTWELIKELEARGYGVHNIAESGNKIEYREKQQ